MNLLLGLLIAILGVVTGLSWRFEWVRSYDLIVFFKVNLAHVPKGLDKLVACARWLGTKWIFILYLGLLLIWDFPVGISISIAGLLTTGVEIGIKNLINRPRPFIDNKQVVLRQNPVPRDTSFPSGDATRIWFIFATLVFGLSPSVAIMVMIGLGSILVSYGRIRLGVHHPLDVWAGSCLGFGLGLAWSSFLP
jgi:membrane-associated phospholipid phosphatase